eukprot:CAMPEP_0206520066 /NCGR_PEP_ID=MMETSP0324_2-20121206/65554_1 /ASSEMBLY_ACC=CAM_ASM_000836 /TAXON_ID=2866 /ORGANISM="Crypthecodinium cohnii, Strain Seligo" /LENGTH=86 /DNA_ID=CAMNT_0054013745 /DNA_START=346 /DNA_END=606 /DNA_ORIENTATION=+
MTCANVVPDFGYDVTHASVGLWTNSPVFHLSIAPVDTATPTGMPETFLKLYPPGQKGRSLERTPEALSKLPEKRRNFLPCTSLAPS